MSAGLFANMGPSSYQVRVPAGREAVYEWAAPVFLSLAITAAGLWYARRRALRAGTRRALLWLVGGSLAVAYSSYWVWSHRHHGTMEPDLAADLAVLMPVLWVVFCLTVVVVRWPRVHGRPGQPPHQADAAAAPASNSSPPSH